MPLKKVTVKMNNDNKPLDPTSSLNKYFMCVCGKKFSYRSGILKHLPTCDNKQDKIVCRWCNLEFKNRGNLINHSFYMHGDKKTSKNLKYKCDVCDARFTDKWKITFHIRRDHFNLCARTPLANAKQVNQVWFERVLNTNLVMQIKKPSANRLILKPTPPSADLKVHGINKMVDLRNEYPTRPAKLDTVCKFCGKMLRKYDLKKHIDERHHNVPKYRCNNCNKTFKRTYIYLKHVCYKKRSRSRVLGVRHKSNSLIRIATVESLKSFVID